MSPMPATPIQADPQQEALAWFSRLRQPGCDEGERQAFGRWCQDPLNAHAYAELEACWQQLQVPPPRPRPRLLKVRRSYFSKVLAALFLLVLGALACLYWPLMQRLASELHTDIGERRSTRLADGSTLHLGSASAMNVDLRGRTRQLHLVQGQVYLDVVLDGRAMEVQVDDARIQVFGTRLMVARHGDHDELLVLNGKAMVIQGGDQRMVSAGERVTFTEARINPVQKADMKTADAWRTGQLHASEMPLGQVIERLASAQGRRVWLMDEQNAYRRVNGDFNLDHPVQTLDALAAEQHLQLYDVLGQWLIVR
ncbi:MULTISPECIES: FecR family protein [unclassified Pseudomonas]|uniref:FecR family protein n=1 Tax=unclassified Pseudomonas TaxID=196821 RepID=UPI000483D2CA|nr:MULTISPECIES: FecR domain-containing protein [unclassified Pseudomonas]RAS23660.1 FecR family protein [Pseudomonas sp. URMO17WK12:I7]SMF44412.1 FecR family protein [Pseudomonas sp. URMO17WK12:I5]